MKSTAMMYLAVAHIEAFVAERRTAADVKRAVRLIRTTKCEPKKRFE